MAKIYLDMDGVLANFDKGVKDLCHMNPASQNPEKDKKKDDEMWDRIREVGRFYDKLEPMPGAEEMFRRIWAKYGKNGCEILTGVPKPKRNIPTAGDDKISWMKRLFSEEITVNIVYREDKPNYCKGKDCVLIDDLEGNIRDWEAMGGTGIRHKNAEETLKELERLGLL